MRYLTRRGARRVREREEAAVGVEEIRIAYPQELELDLAHHLHLQNCFRVSRI